MASFRGTARDLHDRQPALVQTTIVSLALFGVALLGLLFDPRELLGAPIWLKPAKFGLSTAMYLGALAFVAADLRPTPRVRRIGAAIGWLFVGEVLLVSLQAARGVQSHFNMDTLFDNVVFKMMGLIIVTVSVLSFVLLVLHVRTPLQDRAMGMALRSGLALNIIGGAVGWIMTIPPLAQLAAIRAGVPLFRGGAHTVGAADGGVGMAVTNWSTSGGDLRIPHFIGLHALQILPLVVLLVRAVRSRRDDAVERSVLTLATGVCAAAFLGALLQALSGRPLLPLH